MADPAAGSGGFLTQNASAIYYTPQPVIDYVSPDSLMPCPLCDGAARTWIDCPKPVTYCRKCDGPRFYRKSASAAARAWNDYVRVMSQPIKNPPFGS